jgi:catalase (peroxidase I)
LARATYDLLKAKSSHSVESFKNYLKDEVLADVLKSEEFVLIVEKIKKLELEGLGKTAIAGGLSILFLYFFS